MDLSVSQRLDALENLIALSFSTPEVGTILPSAFERQKMRISDLEAEIVRLRNSVDTLTPKVDTSQAFGGRISTLENSMESLQISFDNVPDYDSLLGASALQSQLGTRSLSSVFGDVSALTGLAGRIETIESTINTNSTSLAAYQGNLIGPLQNDGNIGTNLAVGKTLMQCIGDLDAFGDTSLLSHHNVLSTEVESTKDRVDLAESDIDNIKSDIVTLKMAEGGALGDFSTIANQLGDPNNIDDFLSIDNRWPLFSTRTSAEEWMNTHIFDVIHEHLKLALSPVDYIELANQIVNFQVATIGPVIQPQPHVTTETWSKEDENETYYTIVHITDAGITPHNGIMSYTTEEGVSTFTIPPLQGFGQNVLQQLKSMESTISTMKSEVDELEPNEDSLLLHFLLTTHLCNSNLFQKSHLKATSRMIFGMSNSVYFSEADQAKDYMIKGKVDLNQLTLLRGGENCNLIFTIAIGGIPHTAQFEAWFYLNNDSDTAFGMRFTYATGDIHRLTLEQRQSDASTYTEFSGSGPDENRMNPTHYIQLQYKTLHNRFTGVLSTRNIRDDTPKKYTGNYLTVDKNFIYDWIESKYRRLSLHKINHISNSNNPYTVDMRGLTVTMLSN